MNYLEGLSGAKVVAYLYTFFATLSLIVSLTFILLVTGLGMMSESVCNYQSESSTQNFNNNWTDAVNSIWLDSVMYCLCTILQLGSAVMLLRLTETKCGRIITSGNMTLWGLAITESILLTLAHLLTIPDIMDFISSRDVRVLKDVLNYSLTRSIECLLVIGLNCIILTIVNWIRPVPNSKKLKSLLTDLEASKSPILA